MKAYCLDTLNRNEFSQYNSIGASLALDYIEARLARENIDIEIRSRIVESKSRGRLYLELNYFARWQ